MNNVEPFPPPTWVDTPTRFRMMLARLEDEPALAIDTESNSLYAYREQVCLIQISIPGADYLVDPLPLSDLSGLQPLMANSHVLKVLHGAEYDLTVLHRDFGFTLTNLFDTMWASRILGWPEHGLAAVLHRCFGVSLDKKFQRANWGLRPLPLAQLHYARLDSHFLLPLHALQAHELEATKRWPQAHHRFAELVKTRWEPREFEADGFWRLPGVRDLDDVGRGVLQALYVYRDGCARSENRPAFKVLSNQTLLILGERQPTALEGMDHITGLSHRLISKYGRGILEAVRQGKAHPIAWETRPRPTNGFGRPPGIRPSPEAQARFEALRVWRNALAVTRGVEPDIILANQTLWAVAIHNPRHRADLSRDGMLAAWQVDEFGDDLLALIASGRKKTP